METAPVLAPGIPADYYRRIFEAEEHHWWYVGMRQLSATMLGSRDAGEDATLLDAGCGTGGFLRWMLDRGAWTAVAGADLASAALELARERVPEADLRSGPLAALPFDDRSFDVVVSNDVLQHVPEADVGPSLLEIRRVLRPGGTLVLRTNGSRTIRRERVDWRAYDSGTLTAELDEAGFEIERVTHANFVLSVWGALRGRVPHAPSEDTDGIPTRPPGAFVSAVGRRVLAAEARYLDRPGRTLPFGHSLIAVAHRPA
jgi:ubiquinone/menaquinone biosynthesis C-methylase UbiE